MAAGHAAVLPRETAQAFSMGTPQAYDYGIDKLVPVLERHLA